MAVKIKGKNIKTQKLKNLKTQKLKNSKSLTPDPSPKGERSG